MLQIVCSAKDPYATAVALVQSARRTHCEVGARLCLTELMQATWRAIGSNQDAFHAFMCVACEGSLRNCIVLY